MSCLQQVLRMESQVFQGEAARAPVPAATTQVLDADWSEFSTQGGNLSSQEWASSHHKSLFSLLHGPLLVLCSVVTGFSNLWGVSRTRVAVCTQTQLAMGSTGEELSERYFHFQ